MKRITLWCPASDGSAFKEDSLNRGIKVLEEWGYQIYIPKKKMFDNTTLGITALSDNRDILHKFDSNDNSEILMSVYGGYTTNLLLEELSKLTSQGSKLYCGKSDLTCLLNSLYTLFGLKTVYGLDFSKISNPYLTEKELEQLRRVLNKETIIFEKTSQYNDGYWYLHAPVNVESNRWGVIGNKNLQKLSGTSVGGNLESLTTLIGTKYMPDFKNKIVFLESIPDVVPGRFIMDLKRLSMATNLKDAEAIIIGTFGPKSVLNDSDIMSNIIIDEVGINLPVVTNVDISHTEPSYYFYIGGKVELNITENSYTTFW